MSNTGIINNQIRVGAINANSIIANYRRLELLQFLQDYNHDVIFISETKLNNTHKLIIKDYNLIRNDRPNSTQGGGTTILIKKGIQYEECFLPSVHRNEILGISIIKLSISGSNTLYLISAYARNDSRRLFIDELDNLFVNLKSYSCNIFYIMAGDLNASRKIWGDRANNPRGRYLGQWESLVDCDYKLKLITPVVPTFKPAQSFLDVCLSDARLNLLNAIGGKAHTLPYDSDHLALSLTYELYGGCIPQVGAEAEIHRYDFRNASWGDFSRNVEKNFCGNIPSNRNLTIAMIDKGLYHINEAINDSIASSIPRFKAYSNTLRYINRRIRRLQRDKKSIVSLLHRLHILDPLTHWNIIKNAKKAHKALVKAFKSWI